MKKLSIADWIKISKKYKPLPECKDYVVHKNLLMGWCPLEPKKTKKPKCATNLYVKKGRYYYLMSPLMQFGEKKPIINGDCL